MDQVQELIESRPDSALTLLNTIDYNKLSNSKQKHKYTLLKYQANDNSFNSLPTDTLLDKALDYYTSIQDYENMQKAYYYLGKREYQQGAYIQALVNFFTSEMLAKNMRNPLWAGRSAMWMSTIFYETYNAPDELRYALIEFDNFKQTNDINQIRYAKLDLCRAYLSNEQYEQFNKLSQQLFREATQANDQSLVHSICQYNGIKLIKQERYDKAVELYRELCSQTMAVTDDSVKYCWALAKNGEIKRAQELSKQINAFSENLASGWIYGIIYKELGHYDKALSEFERFNNLSNAELKDKMNQNYTSSLEDQLKLLHENNALFHYKRQVRIWLFIAFGCIVVILTTIILIKRNITHREKLSEQLAIVEELKTIIQNHDDNSHKYSSLVRNLFISKFQTIEELCNVLYESIVLKTSDARIASKVKKMIHDISFNDQRYLELEHEMNETFQNVMEDLKTDLPGLKHNDLRLFLFSVMGFSNSIIAFLLQEKKINAVYERKRRLKNKIKQLTPEKQNRYLSLMN